MQYCPDLVELAKAINVCCFFPKILLYWCSFCAETEMFFTVCSGCCGFLLETQFCYKSHELNLTLITILKLDWQLMTKLCWAVHRSTVIVMRIMAKESQIWNLAMAYTMKISHVLYVAFPLCFVCIIFFKINSC